MNFLRGAHAWCLWINNFAIYYKGPLEKPLFSERNGYEKPIIKINGHRLFIKRL